MFTVPRRAVLARTLLLSTCLVPGVSHAETASDAIETITVTATPFASDPDKLSTIVGQVDRTEILRSGGANLSDALANVAGVTGTGFAAGASRPIIRGFDANRVRLLEDGIGSFDVSDVGPDHGVPIDPLSATKIEVVRGAATLRYGSQAIGGVVNAINNRVPTVLPDKSVSGEATAAYATGANDREGSALLDGKAGHFAFHADGFVRRTGDYDIPGGTQPNSFFRGDGASGGGSYFFGDSRVGAAIVHYDATYGIPSDTTFIDMKQTKGLLRSSFAIDAGAFKTLTVDGGYADYDHSETDPATHAILSTFRSQEWDSRAEALFDKIGPLAQSALGVQVQHRHFSAVGEGADYLLPTTTRSMGVFAFTETPLTRGLRLQWGARAEHVDIKGTPAGAAHTDRRFTPISGSVGLVAEVSPALTLGLTLSSAARAPGQTELFARGPHDGPGTFETGDPNLRIERANSLEGTVRYHAKDIDIEGSVWGAKFKNFIYGRLTGSTCNDAGVCAPGTGGELKELLYEQRHAAFRGLEAKATVGVYTTTAGVMNATLLADYVRATLDGAGNVPRIPPYHIGGGLAWEGTAFDAGFVVKHTGAQHDTNLAETPTAGFTTLDVRLGWRPLRSTPGVEFAIVGRNLTDAIARNATAINKDAVVLPGRDVRATVRATF